jgi:transposase
MIDNAAGANSMHKSKHDADSYQRVEVITGRRRRREWSDEEKTRIVAESADLEVNISDVARRNGVSRGLLNVWRRKARQASSDGPLFVQLGIDDGVEARPGANDPPCVVARPVERIEVVIAGATVRVPVGVDAATLECVLAAVRSTR